MARDESTNLVLIMTDQHQRGVAGCYGNDTASTPNLDRFAERGVVFDKAYTPSPICVPARASLATGRYPHQIRCWDNSMPYTGAEADSWAHRVSKEGIEVTSVGKLHYRHESDPTGFDEQILPMHILGGEGDVYGLLRGDMPPRPDSRHHVETAGEGESQYLAYDLAIVDAAIEWLSERASSRSPWVLFVSLTTPHFPLRAPADYLARIDPGNLPPPPAAAPAAWSNHPHISEIRRLQMMDSPFDEETQRRALHSYYALVAFADEQIGRVLKALSDTGLDGRTDVIYTSDHGEMAGAHGLWWKHTMYEPSVGIPLIMAGPSIDWMKGRCAVPVSLVDIFPTVLDSFGLGRQEEDADLPGTSLFEVLNDPGSFDERTIFSEYHATYSTAAMFGAIDERFKLVSHVGYPDQLFDLEADPEELIDLADSTNHQRQLTRLRGFLHGVIDPVAVDKQAKQDQAAKIAAAGGPSAVLSRGVEVDFTPAPAPE